MDDIENEGVLFSGPAIQQLVKEVTSQRHLLDLLKVSKRDNTNFIRRFNYSNRIRAIESAHSRVCDGYLCEDEY